MGFQARLTEKVLPPLPLRVCISSSFDEALNRNLSIAACLAEGFKALIGPQNVCLCTSKTVCEVVLRTSPDLVLLVGSCTPSSVSYEHISHAARSVGSVFAFWSVEDPYEIDFSSKFALFADVIFTNDMWAQHFYDHPKVHHLPTAASPTLHKRPLIPSSAKTIDVFFCGVGFAGRQRLIRDAAPILSRYRTLVAGANWPTLPFSRNERIAPESLCDFYATSRVVLNLGRDLSLANSKYSLAAVTPGPRTYEAAMAGALQLYHLNSRAIEADFVPGEEILTFETIDELADKIRWVLDNPEDADLISKNGQRRALKDHSYARRAESILAAVNQKVSHAT